MRTIAIINQKGGCGKTITAINVAAFLAKKPRKVLLVDMDPQGHATLGLKADSSTPDKTVRDVLLGELEMERTRISDVRLTVIENLDLVPSNILLTTVPEKLAGVRGREMRLSEALEQVRNQYQYVIVDCPPNVGLLTFNALMACSEAIIPLDPSFFSLHGIGKLLETLQVLERKTGHTLGVHALVTLYSGRSEFAREVVQDIRNHMGNRVFETVVRYSVKLAEAASHGRPISTYCTRCVGFEDYRRVAEEILQQESERPQLARPEESEPSGRIPQETLAEMPSPSAPVATRDGVVFTLKAPEASRVQLAGDFNGWMPQEGEMQFSNGVWRKMVSLAPGRYRYRYVVDGRWENDPMNSNVEPGTYGDPDSVIVLD